MSLLHTFEVPALGAPIADTHAHLDMLEDPGAALARAALAGVALVVTVADPSEDAERTFELLAAWRSRAAELLGAGGGSGVSPGSELAEIPEAPEVRVIVGVHPHNAKDFGSGARERLVRLLQLPLSAGVGEIGLDYHYDYSPRDIQRSVFADQLQTAVRLGMPAVIHLREAHEDGQAIMRETGVPREGCVLHCFTGDVDLLEPFLEMGCYVSLAGPVTFKKAEEIREAARIVPLDRLLVETDSPFMTPEPYRGRPNEPALTVYTARRIAQARGLAAADLARATWDNSLRLFAAPEAPGAMGQGSGEKRR